MLQKLAIMALAGALGTLARYGLSGLVQRADGVSFPWGTLAVNFVGCFLAGLLWAAFEHRWPVSAQTRIIIFFGFLGAFTTFSAFIFETGELMHSAQWVYAGVNMLMQNGLGLLALFLGAALGRNI